VNIYDGNPLIVVWIAMIVAGVIFVTPFVILLLRYLNHTWLDREWRATRNRKQAGAD
jgi:hypothetical protein